MRKSEQDTSSFKFRASRPDLMPSHSVGDRSPNYRKFAPILEPYRIPAENGHENGVSTKSHEWAREYTKDDQSTYEPYHDNVIDFRIIPNARYDTSYEDAQIRLKTGIATGVFVVGGLGGAFIGIYPQLVGAVETAGQTAAYVSFMILFNSPWLIGVPNLFRALLSSITTPK